MEPAAKLRTITSSGMISTCRINCSRIFKRFRKCVGIPICCKPVMKNSDKRLFNTPLPSITAFFSERGGGDSFELAVLDSHSLNRTDGNGNGIFNERADEDIILAEGWQLLSDGVFGITLEAPGPIPEPTTSMSMMFAVGVLAFIRRLKTEFDSRKWNA